MNVFIDYTDTTSDGTDGVQFHLSYQNAPDYVLLV